MKVYSGLDQLPKGRAAGGLLHGCMVLEGGAWRGLYTQGALDALMENGINMDCTIGVSAGAMSGLAYVAGQIGWGARIDLTYRHDKKYCGIGAFRRDHGITGFSYLFEDICREHPLDQERLNDPARRLAVSATNLITGKVEYFEKGYCDIFKAVQASASVPFVSRPVLINGTPYLDGGCAEKIPYGWAEIVGEKKTVVVRTRELSYRRKSGAPGITKLFYRNYPNFVTSIENANDNFNRTAYMLNQKSKSGEVFVIAPSEQVTVKRFDGDMEKLGKLYWLGYYDMENRMEELKRYLEQYE